MKPQSIADSIIYIGAFYASFLSLSYSLLILGVMQ